MIKEENITKKKRGGEGTRYLPTTICAVGARPFVEFVHFMHGFFLASSVSPPPRLTVSTLTYLLRAWFCTMFVARRYHTIGAAFGLMHALE